MPARAYLLTLIAFLAFISLGLPDGVLGIAWPSIRHTFHLSLTQITPLLITSTTGYLLSSAFAGRAIHLLGIGRLLLLSSLLVIASLAAYSLAPHWSVMVAFSLFAGLGAGAIDAALNAYASTAFAPRFVTWLHACYGIGTTLGPLIMTTILAASLSWRLGYAIIGAIIVLMCFIFFATRDWWTLSSASNTKAIAPAPSLQTLRLPRAWLNILLFFLYTGAEVTVGAWLFTLLTESRHLSIPLAGASQSAYWAGLTLGRILFGLAAPQFHSRTLLRFAMILAPLAASLLWLDQRAQFSLFWSPLLGFAFAPIYPLLISETPTRLGPSHAPTAIGLQVSAASLGAAALPALASLIARNSSLESLGPFLLTSILLLLVLHEFSLQLSRPNQ